MQGIKISPIVLISMKRFANIITVSVVIIALTLYMAITCRAQPQNEKVAQQIAQFPVGKSFLEIPFQLERDRAIILLTVNNSSPLKFLVDTGSKTPYLGGAAPAESLGLKIIGDAIDGGPGSGAATTVKIAGDVTFNISGATIKKAEMLVPPPPAPTLAPLSDYGIIGRPLFDNFVVEFDWAKQGINTLDSLTI
jgi:hypothetical protein